MAWGRNRNSCIRTVDGIAVADVFRRARGDPEKFTPKPRAVYCGDCNAFLYHSALRADSFGCPCGAITTYGEVKV